jgi:SAM-dependent methyltransferase
MWIADSRGTFGGDEAQGGEAAEEEIMILNLGCGRKRLDGAVNLDRIPALNPDVVHDIETVPWPLEANQFDEVYANDVIEHCLDVVVVLNEIHRVCKPGAVLKITTPHFSSSNSYTDPTHRYHFGYFSFDYFTGERNDLDFYTQNQFRHLKSQIIFHPTLTNKLVWRLANRNPHAYEQRWAWLFPAWFLYFELEVLK